MQVYIYIQIYYIYIYTYIYNIIQNNLCNGDRCRMTKCKKFFPLGFQISFYWIHNGIPINAIHNLSGIKKEINKAYRKINLKIIELYVNRWTTPKIAI